MQIFNTIGALNTYNKLKQVEKNKTNTMGKLSSGKRINKAADDAAGMAISQKMKAQIRGLMQAKKNIQDGISLLQTAEGAMGSIQDIVHRMKELTVQGGNGTLSKNDKEAIQKELDSLKEELKSISNETKFNGMPLIDGTFSHKEEDVAGSSFPDLNVPDDGSVVDQQVMIGDFPIDFEFTKISEEELKVDIKHYGKLLATKSVSKDPIKWVKSIGGSLFDSAEDIVQTNDGGYVLVGRSESNDGNMGFNYGSSDLWAVKLDSNQNIVWKKSIGGSGYDEGVSVEENSSGDIILSGTTTSTDGDKDIYITKLSSNGILKMNKVFGGGADRANSLYPTDDGGYILAGETISTDGGKDILLMKVDASGQYQWEKTLDSGGADYANDIKQTSDGGYIVGGRANSDASLYKLDSTGNVQWNKSYGGYEVNKVAELDSGGYVLAGQQDGGNSQMLIAKTDSSGNEIWKKSIGDTASFDEANSIQEDSSGNYIIAGQTTTTNGYRDFAALKLASDGSEIWSTFNQGFGSNGAEGTKITATSDGGYIVTAPDDSSKDNLAIKFDERGAYQWEAVIGDVDDTITNVRETDSGYVLGGKSSDNSKQWVASLNNDGSSAISKTYIAGSDNTEITDIQKLSTGEYVLAGNKDNSGNNDIWVSKLATDFSQSWEKSFGGSANDTVTTIQETSAGKLILAGTTFSSNGDVSANYGNGDAWIAGLDSDGTNFWEKNLGGSSYDKANSIKETSDGGYIITGRTKSIDNDLSGVKTTTDNDSWVIKLKADKSIDWQKTFGSSNFDEASNVIETSDNGYLISGVAEDVSGNKEAWVVKLAQDGLEQWQNNYSGNFADGVEMTKITGAKYILSGLDDNQDLRMIQIDAANGGNQLFNRTLSGKVDWASSIKETNDGGYILSGTKRYNDGVQNGVIVKFDVDGNMQWEKALSSERTSNIEVDSSGDYIISGTKGGDMWASKVNKSDGSLIWEKNLGQFTASDIKEDGSGNYIISGTTLSTSGDTDMKIVKIDSSGTELWSKNFGGENDWSGNIQQTSDGGYILTGTKTSNDKDQDALILKLDSSGNIQWEENLEDNQKFDAGVHIEETDDGGYIFSGLKESNAGDKDIWIRKLKSNGDLDWENTYGNNNDENLGEIKQTVDGGYIVTGTKDSGNKDIYVMKLASDGSLEWNQSIGGSGIEEGNSIQQLEDGDYIVAGYSTSTDITNTTNNGGTDGLIARISSDGSQIKWVDLLGGSGNEKFNSIKEITKGSYIVAGESSLADGDVSNNHGNSDMWVVNYARDLTHISPYPIKKTIQSPKLGQGITTLDLNGIGDGVDIAFDWDTFSVKSIEAEGKEITDAHLVIQDGANASDELWTEIDNMTAKSLGFTTGWPRVINPPVDAVEKSLNLITKANNKVSNGRTKIGAYHNRLKHISKNVVNTQINLSSANSRIEDADIAKQVMHLSKSQILSQSGIVILSKINNMSNEALQLIRPLK